MKLLDQVWDVGLRRQLSPLTVECYQRWAYDFLRYCADRGAAGAADPDDPFDISLIEDGAGGGRRVWRHPRELSAAGVRGGCRRPLGCVSSTVPAEAYYFGDLPCAASSTAPGRWVRPVRRAAENAYRCRNVTS